MASRRKSERPVDTRGWVTRNQASDLLGVSPQTLMNYERRDLLHPTQELRDIPGRGLRKTILYDPREFTRLPRRQGYAPAEGELAARCFEMFEGGSSLRDIVVMLRVTPQTVSSLREAWLDFGGGAIVISPELKAEFEKHVGPLKSAVDLLNWVEQHAPKRKTSRPAP